MSHTPDRHAEHVSLTKDLAYPGVGLRHDNLLEIPLGKVCLRRDDAAEVEARRRFPTAVLILYVA